MTGDYVTPQRRIGVIDIGSNSVRFVVYELFGANFTPVYNEKVLAGLGRSLRLTGKLDPGGMILARQALLRFKILCGSHDLNEVLIGATAALREAEDAQDFIADIYEETGFEIQPLSGLQEAEVSALGLIAAEPRAKGIAADLGGASLEIMHIGDKKISSAKSFPIGPFQILGRDLTQDAAYDLATLRPLIRSHLKEALPYRDGTPDALYLIGGAWRNLFAVHQRKVRYPLKTMQAYSLNHDAARDLAQWAYGEGRRELLTWPGVNSRRAETLPFSGLLLDELLKTYRPKSVIISTTGLREGLIYRALSDDLKARDALFDGCRDLAQGSLQNKFFARPLYQFLAQAETAFPKAWPTVDEDRLRRAACFLAGVGKGLHPDYKAALVFEDVLYAPFSGLTHKERAYLAVMLYASYTGKERAPNQAAVDHLLTPSEQLAARIYGTAIRLAVVASGHSADLLAELNLSHTGESLSLSANGAYKNLMSQRVKLRFKQLCKAAKLTPIFGA
ncbi:MAG: Ppx/GppA phosphatase family protein [Maricaulaceae bacterium]